MKKNIREVLKNEEISLSDLFQLFYDKRKIIFITVFAVVLLGLLKSCTSPTEYESTAIKLSEAKTDQNEMGQLGGLAGLAGINLSSVGGGNNITTFSPDLYPKLLASKPFLLDLINEEFFFVSMNKKITLKDYYLEERPGDIVTKGFEFIMGIPYLIISIFDSEPEFLTELSKIKDPTPDNYLQITPQEAYVIAVVKEKIKIESEERMITLSVKMPEPIIAAEFNNIVFNKILNYVSSYKISKQKNSLLFIEESTKEAEEKFKRAQINLASFRDSNQGIISQRARTKEEQLEAEFNLSFEIYSTLKQELENSKIELKRETPIFTTFEEAIIPNGPSNSSPIKVILISIFGGLFLGVMIIMGILLRDFIKS
jgi:uncharacterized protein involved in exopolysaccharide biosynthesis